MTNRRNFVKQAGAMIAMATMPGGIQSASERREKSLTLKRSRIKVDDQCGRWSGWMYGCYCCGS